jgi:hypothetical protein
MRGLPMSLANMKDVCMNDVITHPQSKSLVPVFFFLAHHARRHYIEGAMPSQQAWTPNYTARHATTW